MPKTKKEARLRKIKKYDKETAKLRKRARKMRTKRSLAKATIKGLPRAAKKIAKRLTSPLPYSTGWLRKKEKEYKKSKKK